METYIIPTEWNSKSYKSFIEYLISIRDEEYKEFHKSIVLNSKYEMIGIRVPLMRKIAREIAKTDVEKFLECSQDNYYEEIMIQGLVISNIKDEKIFNQYFKMHVNKIDNWALCDTFCSAIKIVKKYEKKYLQKAIEMSLSKEEFISRIGLVTILFNFISENNINIIFETLNKIQSDQFYVNMAEAWLVCEIYVKYPKETLKFIQKNNLNKFTHNKAISKIHDSYRINEKEKQYLSTLRIK